MCLSSGDSWILIPILPSWVHYRLTGPSFDAVWACISLYMSSHVHIVPNGLPRSLCGWSAPPCICWRKDTITRLCTSHTCVTWPAKSLSIFISCTSSFLSLVWKSLSTTDPRLPTTKLMCSDSHFGADTLSAPMMLLCCSFASASFTSLETRRPCLSTV